jgi:hypothetical protein
MYYDEIYLVLQNTNVRIYKAFSEVLLSSYLIDEESCKVYM